MVPFGKVTKEVMTNPIISPGGKALYALLCCYANSDRTCTIGINRMAEELNVDPSSIKRWVRELVDGNIIYRHRTENQKTVTTHLKK